MSFTNGKPWVATKEDCRQKWGLGAPGEKFRCALCGYKFCVGDRVRWQFTNDVPGAGGNPLVCEQCDGPKEEIVKKIISTRKELAERLWWFR